MAWRLHHGSRRISAASIGCQILASLVLGFTAVTVQAGDAALEGAEAATVAAYEDHVTLCLEDDQNDFVQSDAVQLEHCQQAIQSGRAVGQELGHLLVQRGFTLLALGKAEPALESFAKAIPIAATPATAWWGSSVAHARLQRFEEAVADLDKAIALEPYTRVLTIFLYIARSQAHALSAGLGPPGEPGVGRTPETAVAKHAVAALADAGKALALGPGAGRAGGTQAERLLAVGKVREALVELDTAIGRDPRSGYDYYLRGVVHDLLGQSDAAVADFDKAIELEPSLAEAFTRRGRLYLERQRSADALADLDVAIMMQPEDAAGYYLRAAAYARLAREAEAARDVAKACTLQPLLLRFLADPRRLADPTGGETTAGAFSACSPYEFRLPLPQ
jgi:tetratricopeptide (TPR) repeat protein